MYFGFLRSKFLKKVKNLTLIVPNVRAHTPNHRACVRTEQMTLSAAVKRNTPFSDAHTRFMTTRWSVVLSCSDSATDEEKAQGALAELCKIYWRPVFAFICRQGHSVPDAQDLTQEFFGRVIKGRLIQSADRNKGRFRSLLLKALQRFLHDQGDKRQARKRGGDLRFVSWDDWMTEAPSHLSMPEQECDNWSPERIFDVRWAATVVERALRRLGDECEKRGRRRVFDVLSGYLTADREDVSYARFARILGLQETAVKNLVHRLRERYRALLREEVAETVGGANEIDDELRYLCAALSAAK
jgi:RNA polymerase sigma factor (sigma-70 family)